MDRSIVIVGGSGDASSKTVGYLPHYYTDAPLVASNAKKSSVSAARVAPLTVRDEFKQQTEEEYLWLDHAKQVMTDKTGTEDNTSWAAFHTSHQNLESSAPPPCFRCSWT
ncbi:hypothetical protein LSAT2_032408, partial [Lamellibrachia satsuma]